MQLSLKLHTRSQLPAYPDMDQANHKVTSKSRSVKIYEWIRRQSNQSDLNFPGRTVGNWKEVKKSSHVWRFYQTMGNEAF